MDDDNCHSAVFRVWPISIENQELPYALHLTSSAAKNLDLGEIDLHCVRIKLESWTHPKTSAKQISLRSRKVENEKLIAFFEIEIEPKIRCEAKKFYSTKSCLI